MKMLTSHLLLISTISLIEIDSGLIVKKPVLNKFGMEMFWVDGRDRLDDPVTIDTLFDRCVCISMRLDPELIGKHHYKYYRHEVTGVFITEWLVLTSYNPFRNLVRNKTLLGSFQIKRISGRYIKNPVRGAWSYYRHDSNIHFIACARQVAPPFDQKSQPLDMRHGIHSPLHDLMVIRLKEKIEFLQPIPEVKYDFDDFNITGEWDARMRAYLTKGYTPIKTKLAVMGDKLNEAEMNYASIAHIDDIHIFENRYLEKGNVTGKNMITNCDEWLPRKWGHFICLKNIYNYEGMASGAVLFGGLKLFGIGAFAIWKEKDNGVLVFTDVRPYMKLVKRTCTHDDQKLVDPSATAQP